MGPGPAGWLITFGGGGGSLPFVGGGTSGTIVSPAGTVSNSTMVMLVVVETPGVYGG